MMTLRQFGAAHLAGSLRIPAATAWYLSELAEARGRQELFARQAPQRLTALRESAIVESAVSSNRIEGVEIEPVRVAPVVLGTGRLRDRDEQEVRGYRNALKLVHERAADLSITETTVRELHRRSRGGIGDAGVYRTADADIIERCADGRSRVRFRPLAHASVAEATRELVTEWQRCTLERWLPAPIALAGLNLDFLCIHPFRDGNGRVSRLLMLLQCYHAGLEAGRYMSLERVSEENKARYYETLEESSRGWHEGRHDPWPYINYLLYVLVAAYKEFENRVGDTRSPPGAKTELVLTAIQRVDEPFRVADLQRTCPGVSLDMIRRILKLEQAGGRVECLGRGPAARWRRRELDRTQGS